MSARPHWPNCGVPVALTGLSCAPHHVAIWPICARMRAVLKSTQTAQSHPNPIQRGPIAPPRVHMPVWLPMHWPRCRYRASYHAHRTMWPCARICGRYSNRPKRHKATQIPSGGAQSHRLVCICPYGCPCIGPVAGIPGYIIRTAPCVAIWPMCAYAGGNRTASCACGLAVGLLWPFWLKAVI